MCTNLSGHWKILSRALFKNPVHHCSYNNVLCSRTTACVSYLTCMFVPYQVDRHFMYDLPHLLNGAEEMIWRTISRRLKGKFDDRFRRERINSLITMLNDNGLSAKDVTTRPRYSTAGLG